MQLDHVLLATRDIAATARHLLADYGLASVPGGDHPQWGTGNRIVPVGEQYLEIIGITDPARAADTPLGRWITARTGDGDVLAGAMVEPDDFDGVCRRLHLTPTPGHRDLPDGTTVSWRLAGLTEAMTRAVPCFIAWDSRAGRLGAEAPEAGVRATGVASVEFGGDAGELAAWLGDDAPAGWRSVGGSPGVRAVTIATDAGEIRLPEHP